MCKRLPERLAVHVLLCDAVVGQRFVPHRVQCVANNLGLQFVSLRVVRGAQIKNHKSTQSLLEGECVSIESNLDTKQCTVIRSAQQQLGVHIMADLHQIL